MPEPNATMEELIAKLQDPNVDVRIEAMRELDSDDSRVVEQLVSMLDDPNFEIASEAAYQLVVLDNEQGLEFFIKALQHTNPDVRSEAAKSLGLARINVARELLIAQSDGHARPLTRVNAAIEPLIAQLSDENKNVRAQAAVSLLWLEARQAVEPLLKALESESDTYTCACIVATLAGTTNGRTHESVVKALHHNKGYVRMVGALESESDASIRASIVRALGGIADGRAYEPILKALHDSDGYVRMSAAIALGELADARAIEPLIAALKDSEARVRYRSAEALGGIGDTRAIPPLTVLVETDTGILGTKRIKKVADAAEEAIQKIKARATGRDNVEA